MNFGQNLFIRKNMIGAPQQIAMVCLVIAVICAPFMLRNFFNKNKRAQRKEDYRYVQVPADYKRPATNAEGDGPSYYLIWAIVLLFGGLIGTIGLVASNLGASVWIILPILAVAAGIICLLINFKGKR